MIVYRAQSIVFVRTSLWAKGINTKSNRETYFVFPLQSFEILVERKETADRSGLPKGSIKSNISTSNEISEPQQLADVALGALGAVGQKYFDASKKVLTYKNYKQLWDTYLTRYVAMCILEPIFYKCRTNVIVVFIWQDGYFHN